MKDFISISQAGTIRVLGVPFCATNAEATEILEKQGVNIRRNFDGVNINFISAVIDWQVQNLPKITSAYFHFRAKKKERSKGEVEEVSILDYISFSKVGISKAHRDSYFEYFKSLFANFFVELDNGELIVLFNTLYKIEIEKGYAERFCHYTIRLSISVKHSSDLLSKYDTIRNEYLRPQDEPANILKESRKFKVSNYSKEIKSVAKVVLILAGFILAYFFVLNDRYYVTSNGGLVFDKWNKGLLQVNDNGKYSPINQ